MGTELVQPKSVNGQDAQRQGLNNNGSGSNWGRGEPGSGLGPWGMGSG